MYYFSFLSTYPTCSFHLILLYWKLSSTNKKLFLHMFGTTSKLLLLYVLRQHLVRRIFYVSSVSKYYYTRRTSILRIAFAFVTDIPHTSFSFVSCIAFSCIYNLTSCTAVEISTSAKNSLSPLSQMDASSLININ